jgi:membrane-associated phospholipid phosphatase
VRSPVLKAGAMLWGPAIGLAVVATGNHFIFDIVAGLVASAAGYLAGSMIGRVSAPQRRPVPALRPNFAQT